MAFESHVNDDDDEDEDDVDLNVITDRRRESSASPLEAVSRLRAAMRRSRGILRLRRLVSRLRGDGVKRRQGKN